MSSSGSEDDDSSGIPEDEYVVESIKGIKWDDIQNKVLYLIHWRGYTDDDDTWEPEENLGNAAEIVAQFADRKKQLMDKHGPKKNRPGPASRKAAAAAAKVTKRKSSDSSDSDSDTQSKASSKKTGGRNSSPSPAKKSRGRTKSPSPPPASLPEGSDSEKKEPVKRKMGPKSKTQPPNIEPPSAKKKSPSPPTGQKKKPSPVIKVKVMEGKKVLGPRSRRAAAMDESEDEDASGSEEESVGRKRKRSTDASHSDPPAAATAFSKRSKKMADDKNTALQAKSYLSESSSSDDEAVVSDKKEETVEPVTVPVPVAASEDKDKQKVKDKESSSGSSPPSSPASSSGSGGDSDELAQLAAELGKFKEAAKPAKSTVTPSAAPTPSRTAGPASKKMTVASEKPVPTESDKTKKKRTQRPQFVEEEDEEEDEMSGLGFGDSDDEAKKVKKSAPVAPLPKEQVPDPAPAPVSRTAASTLSPVVKTSTKKEEEKTVPNGDLVTVYKMEKVNEKRSIERGAVPEEILNAAAVCGEVVFLIRFKGMTRKQAEVVSLNEIRDEYHQMVIHYLQSRFVFVDLNEHDQPFKKELKSNQDSKSGLNKDVISSPASDSKKSSSKFISPLTGDSVAPKADSTPPSQCDDNEEEDDISELGF